MHFELIHRPDLVTHFYAELWCGEPFLVKMPYAVPCEVKGDERGIGCKFKLDVVRPFWVSWEGTEQNGVRVLWVAAADRVEPAPAPHVQLIKSGVNIGRWISEPDPDPKPDPKPDPDPEKPALGWLDEVRVIVFCGANVTRPVAVLWGGYELVYQVPDSWLVELRGLACGLAEAVRGVPIVRKERKT